MEKAGKRKILTLEAKLEIVKQLEKGEKISVLSKRHNMNESSIRRIKLNAEKIKSSVVCSTSLAAKTLKKPRNSIIEKTEKVLSFWIEDQNQKRMPLSAAVIRTKALLVFNRLQNEEPGSSNSEEIKFQASKGWFEKFKHRQNLHNIKFTGEAISLMVVDIYQAKFSMQMRLAYLGKGCLAEPNPIITYKIVFTVRGFGLRVVFVERIYRAVGGFTVYLF